MDASVAAVHELVEGIEPWDVPEAEHRAVALAWLESTDDVFRRIKPASPEQHLVSYVALMDSDGAQLLVEHAGAGLWLPPGGHVDPGEHPARAARREAEEELGIAQDFAGHSDAPSFVTVTRTGGVNSHVDVSLWFVCHGAQDMTLTPDLTELRAARWWSTPEIADTGAERFDPHYPRFLAKTSYLADTAASPGAAL